MSQWFAPISLLGLIVLVFYVGRWTGKIGKEMENVTKTADADRDTFQKTSSEDRARFRAVLDEIREDIKKIFLRLKELGLSP